MWSKSGMVSTRIGHWSRSGFIQCVVIDSLLVVNGEKG